MFQLNPDKDPKEDAKYVRSDLMAKFTNRLDSAQSFIPSLQGLGPTDARNKLVEQLVLKWGQLSDKEKAQFNRSANKEQATGFYLFAMDEANDFITNRKLGE